MEDSDLAWLFVARLQVFVVAPIQVLAVAPSGPVSAVQCFDAVAASGQDGAVVDPGTAADPGTAEAGMNEPYWRLERTTRADEY